MTGWLPIVFCKIASRSAYGPAEVGAVGVLVQVAGVWHCQSAWAILLSDVWLSAGVKKAAFLVAGQGAGEGHAWCYHSSSQNRLDG